MAFDEYGNQVADPTPEPVQQQVDPNVLALALGIQNDPVRLAALAQSFVPQQPQAQAPVQPVAPVVQPWEDPNVIEELNALQFSDQTAYNRRMMDLSTQRAMAQMQPQMQAASNAGFVQEQLLADVRSRGMTPQETQMLEQQARQVVQDLQRENPGMFRDPAHVVNMGKQFMNAKSWELMQARAGQPSNIPVMARNMGGPGQAPVQGQKVQPTADDVIWAERFRMSPEKYAFHRMEREAGR
jgi:hypothetical protein